MRVISRAVYETVLTNGIEVLSRGSVIESVGWRVLDKGQAQGESGVSLGDAYT